MPACRCRSDCPVAALNVAIRSVPTPDYPKFSAEWPWCQAKAYLGLSRSCVGASVEGGHGPGAGGRPPGGSELRRLGRLGNTTSILECRCFFRCRSRPRGLWASRCDPTRRVTMGHMHLPGVCKVLMKALVHGSVRGSVAAEGAHRAPLAESAKDAKSLT